tara:strand:+ start:1271 stop:1507 length:237 start_codon:yes stop_codon:yes gene_type:complete
MNKLDLIEHPLTKTGEIKILKEQIKHLDGIIEVLKDIEQRNSNLKEVRRERGWLAEYLNDAEIELMKGKNCEEEQIER